MKRNSKLKQKVIGFLMIIASALFIAIEGNSGDGTGFIGIVIPLGLLLMFSREKIM